MAFGRNYNRDSDRDYMPDHINERNDQRRKLTNIVCVLLVLYVVWTVIQNYSEPVDKQYSPDNYYTGLLSDEAKRSLASNPRDVYNQFMVNKSASVTGTICKETPLWKALSDVEVKDNNGLYVWPVGGDKTNWFNAASDGHWNLTEEGNPIDNDNNHYYLWRNSPASYDIVSPWMHTKFLNANVTDTSLADGTDIIITNSDAYDSNQVVYALKFANALNWFCHAGDQQTAKKHGTVVGLGATNNSDVIGGNNEGWAIVGKAYMDTYVVGLKYEPGSNKPEEIDPYEVFYHN